MDKDVLTNHVLNSVCLGFNMFVSLVQKEHFKYVARCYDIKVENDSTQDIFYPIFPITNETSTFGKIGFGLSQAWVDGWMSVFFNWKCQDHDCRKKGHAKDRPSWQPLKNWKEKMIEKRNFNFQAIYCFNLPWWLCHCSLECCYDWCRHIGTNWWKMIGIGMQPFQIRSRNSTYSKIGLPYSLS